jgi:hypothetical protein
MNEKTIKVIEKRLARLEDAVFGKKIRPAPKVKGESFSGATGGVRLLISKDFFGSKRVLGEVRDALTKDGYHYSRQTVDMALSGLSLRKGPLTVLKEGGRNVYVIRK